MQIEKIIQQGIPVASVYAPQPILTDLQSALDLMMTVRYETGCNRMAVNRDALAESFFLLHTRLAGEVLQKFVNYGMKLAIYGDFSLYSESMQAFIRESNRGRDVFFTQDRDEAVARLAGANGEASADREEGNWEPDIRQ